MRVCSVVGARPQFVKASVVSAALATAGVEEDLVHTGQHYDDAMSRLFFDELEIPIVKENLGVGSGSHAVQTGSIMTRLEDFLRHSEQYDFVLVYGDTNSTVAAAIVASKLNIPLAHVEAGLRSFNRSMPEEINRVVTDRLSKVLFCPSEAAVANLSAEGITDGVVNIGDVMYDALLRFLPKATSAHRIDKIIPFGRGEYYLATVHRAENTDDEGRLREAVRILGDLDLPVVWPVHPRAADRLRVSGIVLPPAIRQLPPCGYLQMLALLDGARAVLTDSGGLQKEAFWLGKKCITLRSETEWVETLQGGWNAITGMQQARVVEELARPPSTDRGSPYGSGNASSYVASTLLGTKR